MILRRPIPLLLLASLLLPGLAQADEVQVRTEDGHVIATAVLDGSLSAARALLRDPSRVAAVEGRGAEVISQPKDGCIESSIIAPSGVGKVRYTSLSCPVQDGFEGSLVSSKQIREMKARWTLKEEEGRLRIQYDLYVVPKIRVPQKLVAFLAKRGVKRLVESVRDALEQEGGAER